MDVIFGNVFSKILMYDDETDNYGINLGIILFPYKVYICQIMISECKRKTYLFYAAHRRGKLR